MQNARNQTDYVRRYQEFHHFHFQKNCQIISNAQVTANSILSKKSDFYGKRSDQFDHALNRYKHRLTSIASDTIFYFVFNKFFNFTTFVDYKIDVSKTRKLIERINYLNTIQVQPGTCLDLCALKALATQKKIYENLLEYTVKSKRIKLFSFFMSTGSFALMSSDAATKIACIATGCLFVHWLAGGSNLEGRNQILAESLVNPLC